MGFQYIKRDSRQNHHFWPHLSCFLASGCLSWSIFCPEKVDSLSTSVYSDCRTCIELRRSMNIWRNHSPNPTFRNPILGSTQLKVFSDRKTYTGCVVDAPRLPCARQYVCQQTRGDLARCSTDQSQCDRWMVEKQTRIRKTYWLLTCLRTFLLCAGLWSLHPLSILYTDS